MRRLLLKGFLITLVLSMGLAAAPSALAYTVGPGSSGNAPGGASCGQAFTFSGTFVQPDGTAFPAGVPVGFSESSGPGAVSFSSGGTATSASGTFSTVVTLPSSCAGQFVICATPAGGASLCVTVTGVAVGFPNTAAALVSEHSRDLLPAILGLAVLLVAAALSASMAIRLSMGRRTTRKPAV
jgi:hypothetical protein